MYVTASAIAFSAATFTLTGDNTFTLPGVMAWLVSIGLWIVALSEADPRTIWEKARQIKPDVGSWRPPKLRPWPWLVITLAVTALGAYFRLYRLGGIPPEMTSDPREPAGPKTASTSSPASAGRRPRRKISSTVPKPRVSSVVCLIAVTIGRSPYETFSTAAMPTSPAAHPKTST